MMDAPQRTDQMTAAAAPVIDVQDLSVQFTLDEGTLKAVDHVSFAIEEGQIFGLIGESGCGKTVTAQSLMRLVPTPGQIINGQINYRREKGDLIDLAAVDGVGPAVRSIRGNEIAMIFQEPMSSLSPIHSIGNQLMEAILLHITRSKREAYKIALDMLDLVGIANPARRMEEYPHHFSGGMRQRVMIAMALSCRPRLLIADEPTTALDVTVQAQILDLIARAQSQFQMAVLYITHDLGIIAEICDKVAVMYLGKIVEQGSVRDIFHNPMHPYTRRLLASTPRIGQHAERLQSIEGTVPIPIGLPHACGFCSRCPDRVAGLCDAAVPALVEVESNHSVRCFLHSEREEAAS
ncbi:MAG: ABC transporter ATP-binding protein [Chloroflexota bacterium]|nr:ABC transporter ATP-binding protein [Chloroflexota bacterium]MDE2949038.1 ABC transporter ATP-binding protein [Chloroflexota bacterium]